MWQKRSVMTQQLCFVVQKRLWDKGKAIWHKRGYVTQKTLCDTWEATVTQEIIWHRRGYVSQRRPWDTRKAMWHNMAMTQERVCEMGEAMRYRKSYMYVTKERLSGTEEAMIQGEICGSTEPTYKPGEAKHGYVTQTRICDTGEEMWHSQENVTH